MKKRLFKSKLAESTLNNLLWELFLFKFNNDARICFPKGAGVFVCFFFLNLLKVSMRQHEAIMRAEHWSKQVRCSKELLFAFGKCLQYLSVLLCIKPLAHVSGMGHHKRLQDAWWYAWDHLLHMDKISSGVQDSWKYFLCFPRFCSHSSNAVVFFTEQEMYIDILVLS